MFDSIWDNDEPSSDDSDTHATLIASELRWTKFQVHKVLKGDRISPTSSFHTATQITAGSDPKSATIPPSHNTEPAGVWTTFNRAFRHGTSKLLPHSRFSAVKVLEGENSYQTPGSHITLDVTTTGLSSEGVTMTGFTHTLSRAASRLSSHFKFYVGNVFGSDTSSGSQTPGSYIAPTITTSDPPAICIPPCEEATLNELRARSDRTLGRAASQLLSHSSGRNPLSTAALVNLLEAIYDVARTDPHKSESTPNLQENANTLSSFPALTNADSLKTTNNSHPQESNNSSSPVAPSVTADSPNAEGTPDPPERSSASSSTTPIGYSMKYLISAPDDIGAACGLLAGFTTLLGNVSMMELPKLEITTLNAIGTIGPELIKQWAQKQLSSPLAPAHATEYMDYLNQLPGFTCNTSLAANISSTKSAIACLLEIAHFAVLFINSPGVCELSDLALESLYNRASAPSTQYITHEAIRPRIGMIQSWVKSVSSAKLGAQGTMLWRQRAKIHLVRLLAIQDEKRQSILHHLLRHTEDDPNCYQDLSTMLQLMSTASGYPEDIQELLETILSRVRDRRNGHLFKTFSADCGFHYLQNLGLNCNLAAPVARTIRKLTIHLANGNADGSHKVGIQYGAFPGFLNAIAFVCEHMPSQWEKSVDSFVVSAVTLLQRSELSKVAPQLLAQKTLDDLKAASTQMRNDTAKARFTSMHEEVHRIIHATTDERLRAAEPDIQGIQEVGKKV